MEIVEKIGYARVSTTDQDPENQIRLLASAGIASDYIFVDRGISGTIPAEKRPGYKKMLQYVEEHPNEVQFLYVYEISRLGRTTLETINTIADLEKQGLMVWSMSPNESFTRSSDRNIRQLLMMILSWVAQRERDNLVERTKAGIDRARSEGTVLGRPRTEIDWVAVNKMEFEKKPYYEIAKELGCPVMTLYRARKRRGLI